MMENKYLSNKNNDIIKISLIKDIVIRNYSKDYRYIDNDKYHIVFNLIDGNYNIWRFEDEDVMDDILIKIKKQLLTIEIA